MCDVSSKNSTNKESNVPGNHSKLLTLKRKFLCCFLVSSINWEEILFDISWDEQKILLDYTLHCKENQDFPIRCSYQLSFLKVIIQTLGKNNHEIHDTVYETYCALQTTLAKGTQDFAFKHYLIVDPDVRITLKESSSFVTKGTTGLCSWQAAIALSDYLLKNPEIVREKSILELGSGTGLCSFVTSKCCSPSKVVLSDGSLKVINLLDENLQRNYHRSKLKTKTQQFKLFETEQGEIGIWHLPWEEIEEHKIEEIILPEVILAADVVYDEDVFPILSQTIDVLFNKANDTCVMYLAATVRNENTLRKFFKILDDLKFVWQKMEHSACNSQLFWDTRTPIEIILITRK